MAEKTRRAYGIDVGQLAEWASGRGLGPTEVGARELRLYAAVVSERGASKATVSRKLAATRSFYRCLQERELVPSNPAELVAAPRRESKLPQVLKRTEAAAMLDSIPTGTPLELRDRAMFEMAYGAGLRAEELVNLDLTDADADAEELRVTGKGSRTRVVPAGEPVWTARARLPRPGPPGAGQPRQGSRARAARLQDRQTPVHLGRPAPPARLDPAPGTALRLPRGGIATCAASQLCHASAGRRRRSARQSRSCSAMRPSAPHRSTRASRRHACVARIGPHTPARKP